MFIFTILYNTNRKKEKLKQSIAELKRMFVSF